MFKQNILYHCDVELWWLLWRIQKFLQTKWMHTFKLTWFQCAIPFLSIVLFCLDQKCEEYIYYINVMCACTVLCFKSSTCREKCKQLWNVWWYMQTKSRNWYSPSWCYLWMPIVFATYFYCCINKTSFLLKHFIQWCEIWLNTMNKYIYISSF